MQTPTKTPWLHLKGFAKTLEQNKRLEFGLAAKYSESEILPFDTVDVAFLVEYEMWMLSEGKRTKGSREGFTRIFH
ncbi:hypothetical protein [Arcticibacterium luteifluviistationis]|uniref:Uncharacterized protein n=1 Tax=Arcticibacterium luteifluviistationis TaxID=1784714 RepID=A0A2Z4GBB1_9BACT|nr:hypothetical protein [Arcticibacterium luteifluviistationis]AWV98487.1 hypothetical protein DJ013_10010 [Arcticibacterium luteifluviistationis]